MNLAMMISLREAVPVPVVRNIRAGGPGSGCRGPHCGRPKSDTQTVLAKIPKSEYKLSQDRRAVESRFRMQIAKDLDGAKAAYTAKHGDELNADDAKELSPDFRNNRTDNAMAAHEPASWLVGQLFADKLAQPAPPGKSNSVLFMAGAAGVGKTTAINHDPATSAIKDRSQIVYDGTLRPATSAIKKIEQAREAGKCTQVIYVHREPVDSWVNGVLKRAMRPDENSASGIYGRVVPMNEFANQHFSVLDSMRALQSKYGGDPTFRLNVIDNTRGLGKSRASTLDKVHDFTKDGTREELIGKLKEATKRALQDKTINEKVYKAVLVGLDSGSKEVGV